VEERITEHRTPVRVCTFSIHPKNHSATFHNALNAANHDSTQRCCSAMVSPAKVEDHISSVQRNQSTTVPYHLPNTGRTEVDAQSAEDQKTMDNTNYDATAFPARVRDLISSQQKDHSTVMPYHLPNARTEVDARNAAECRTMDQKNCCFATAFPAKVVALISSVQNNRTVDHYQLEMHL